MAFVGRRFLNRPIKDILAEKNVDPQTTFGQAHKSKNHGSGKAGHSTDEPLVQMDLQVRDSKTGKLRDVIERFGVEDTQSPIDLMGFSKPKSKAPALVDTFAIMRIMAKEEKRAELERKERLEAKEYEERRLFEENSARIARELFKPKVDLPYKLYGFDKLKDTTPEYKPFDMLELPKQTKPWLYSFEKDASIDNSVLSMYDERRAKEKKDALMFSTYVDPVAQRLAEMKLNSMASALDRLDNLPGRICGAARPYLPLDSKKPWF